MAAFSLNLNASSSSASTTTFSRNLKPSSSFPLPPTITIPSRHRSLLPAFGLINDSPNNLRARVLSHIISATMAAGVGEILPPPLTSASDPPPIFDGATRLYLSYTCPYAQRVWIARNCKGLQEEIKLVALDLKDRPSWYKDKVYPPNKVPALEHNNEVRGESLDLMKYIDTHFHGPELLPHDPAKGEFAEELFSNAGSFHKAVSSTLKGEADEAVTGAAFDDIEVALSKFDDGPFFLGQFSLADIVYAPFIERYQPVLLDMRNYDITAKRPKLATWVEEMSKNDGYNQTRRDPKEHVENYKKRFAVTLLFPSHVIVCLYSLQLYVDDSLSLTSFCRESSKCSCMSFLPCKDSEFEEMIMVPRLWISVGNGNATGRHLHKLQKSRIKKSRCSVSMSCMYSSITRVLSSVHSLPHKHHFDHVIMSKRSQVLMVTQ